MTSQTYPAVPGASDRRTVSYSFDTAGRLSSLASSATSYAPAASVSSIAYASHGALASETYGNSLVHAATYNNRLQTSEIKLGTSGSPTSVIDLTYNYGTTGNNGNVQSASYVGGGLSYTQTFSYDALNRLSTATETSGGNTSWSQTNGYDRYGNRWIDLGGGNQSLNISTSTNRITNTGFTYDSSGNLTNDTIHSYTYDGEGHIKTVDSTTAYVYDGDGARVRKLVGENTRFVYGLDGDLIAEFDGSSGNLKKEYISGALATIEPTAVNSNGTRYNTLDNLGSPRVITNSSGSIIGRRDFMPFGEELGVSVGGRTSGMGFGVTDGNRDKFTGYKADTETGLNFAEARYQSATQGRFSSPDPLSASMTSGDPQSFNRYSYVGNNPINATDPTGLAMMNNPGAGSLPGAIGALGRAKPGEGLDPSSATDPTTRGLSIGAWNTLSLEQQRLFRSYYAMNYARPIGEDALELGAATLWNLSVMRANSVSGAGSIGSYQLLDQSQLTTFIGVTSMWAHTGVSPRIAVVSEIRGDIPDDNFALRGVFADGGGAYVKSTWESIGGEVHVPYEMSKRERGYYDQPNGQFKLTGDLKRFQSDVDYNRLLVKKFGIPTVFPNPAHNSHGNSDIRHGNQLERHVEWYGPIPILPR